MKKYEFTGETKVIENGRKKVELHRIRAVNTFGNVKAGDIGGWIESEECLSRDGDAWVYGDAIVSGNARVYGDARVCGEARVYDEARVYGNAQVYDDAWVYDDAQIYGNARVYDDARVCGNARVYDDARVCGNAWILGEARVYSKESVLTVSPVGRRNDYTTFYSGEKEILVKCGCFHGSISEFLEKVRETHGNSRHAMVYQAAAETARRQIIPQGVDGNLTREAHEIPQGV